MICWRTKSRTTDYIDGRLRKSEESGLAKHLDECPSCSTWVEQMRSVRAALNEVPTVVAPSELSMALRVEASRERQAVVASHGSRFRRLWDQWRFRIDAVMRPLTIPATGGVVSSLILFGGLGFTAAGSNQMVNYEVPVVYADHIDTNLVPMDLRSSVMVTFSLDGNGRITDYSVRDSSTSFVGDPSRLQPNNISMPSFPSVLALAQPVTSDVSILFRPIVFRQ